MLTEWWRAVKQQGRRSRMRLCVPVRLLLVVLLMGGLTSCALPQVSAEARLFLPLEIELLDVTTLPPQTFAATTVGGLSAITYDAARDVFYALSDDRSRFAPARFYTLNIATDTSQLDAPQIQAVGITAVTTLKDAAGNEYPSDRLDAEGLVLSPRRTLFVSSEGVAATQAPPALNEYDIETGILQTELRLPERFFPAPPSDASKTAQGVRENLGFEALTINPTSSAGAFEPFRLFTATESALAQDFDQDPENPLISRFLHYLVGPDQATFIAEYAYPLELEPLGAVVNGLTELLAIDQGGHFLGIERVYGLRGFAVKLWQLATGGATDISTRVRLSNLDNIQPIQKQLLLDFETLESPVAIENLEGMTLGPPLPDGAMSLWLISDNNFSEEQSTQIWWFRLAIA